MIPCEVEFPSVSILNGITSRQEVMNTMAGCGRENLWRISMLQIDLTMLAFGQRIYSCKTMKDVKLNKS